MNESKFHSTVINSKCHTRPTRIYIHVHTQLVIKRNDTNITPMSAVKTHYTNVSALLFGLLSISSVIKFAIQTRVAVIFERTVSWKMQKMKL